MVCHRLLSSPPAHPVADQRGRAARPAPPPPPPPRSVPLWRDLSEVPAEHGPCVVTIGVFDGIHRGHRHLIDRAVSLGCDRGLPTVLMTFDPHPARVLGIDRDTAALSTVERRAELAADLGVDAVCVLRFTRDLAALSPQDFAEHILARTLNATAVVVGANFTFGARGAGNLDTLRELGDRFGFTASGVGLVEAVDTTACSSTYTRRCIRTGDLSEATRALGRPHRVDGHLHCGVLTLAADTSLPPPGHYTGTVDTHPAVIEVTDHHTLHLHTATNPDEQLRAIAVTFHRPTGLPASTSII